MAEGDILDEYSIKGYGWLGEKCSESSQGGF